MLPHFPPLPSDIISRREGRLAAIGVTVAMLATLATGFLIGWAND